MNIKKTDINGGLPRKTFMLILERAISRIERGWTQGASARDASGERLYQASDSTAVCWCLVGAIQGDVPEQFSESDTLYNLMFDKLPRKSSRNLSEWNDEPSRKRDEVLALLKSVQFSCNNLMS